VTEIETATGIETDQRAASMRNESEATKAGEVQNGMQIPQQLKL
jgi:hypothetical protein